MTIDQIEHEDMFCQRCRFKIRVFKIKTFYKALNIAVNCGDVKSEKKALILQFRFRLFDTASRNGHQISKVSGTENSVSVFSVADLDIFAHVG